MFGHKQDIRASICSIDDNLGVGAAPSCLSAQANDTADDHRADK
jgi:hypothetical protein